MKAEDFKNEIASNCVGCPVIDFINKTKHVDLILTDYMIRPIVSYAKRHHIYTDCVEECLKKYADKDPAMIERT